MSPEIVSDFPPRVPSGVSPTFFSSRIPSKVFLGLHQKWFRGFYEEFLLLLFPGNPSGAHAKISPRVFVELLSVFFCICEQLILNTFKVYFIVFIISPALLTVFPPRVPSGNPSDVAYRSLLGVLSGNPSQVPSESLTGNSSKVPYWNLLEVASRNLLDLEVLSRIFQEFLVRNLQS